MLYDNTAQTRVGAIEKFINDYCSTNGTAPSIREIAEGLGLGKSTVYYHVKRMEAEGRIESRGHRGVYTARELKDRGPFVPILGSVACGAPLFAEENVEEYVRLPESLFGRGEFFFLRAHGQSMIGVGIDEDDLVLVRQQEMADPGDIVVALIDRNETTLKRFYPQPETGEIWLHPENPAEPEQYYAAKRVSIQGVAVKVIKNL